MRPPWSHALVRRGAPAKSARNLLFDKMDPPPDTLPPDDHDGDEQQADPKLPVTRREVGEIILQQPVDQSADEAAIEIAGAADDEDQQDVGRTLDRQHGERREGLSLRQQAARDPRIARRQRIDGDQPPIHADPNHRTAQPLPLDGFEVQRERRNYDAPFGLSLKAINGNALRNSALG